MFLPNYKYTGIFWYPVDFFVSISLFSIRESASGRRLSQCKQKGQEEEKKKEEEEEESCIMTQERKKKNSIREIPLADSPFLSFPHLGRHVSCHSARFSYSLPSQEEGYFARCKSKGDLTASAVKAPRIIPISSFLRCFCCGKEVCQKLAVYQCVSHVRFFFLRRTRCVICTRTRISHFFLAPPRRKSGA